MARWPTYIPLFKIEYDADLVTVRNHNRLMKWLHQQMAWRHHQEFMPDHFANNPKTAPGGEYGYRKRTAKYQREKARVKRHQRPLVWSGELRQRTMDKGRTKVTATKDKARLTMRPIYFRTSNAIRPELEAHPASERKLHAQFLKKVYAAKVATPEYKRKRRRKGATT